MKYALLFILCLLIQASLSGCIPALGTNSTPEIPAHQLSAEQFASRIKRLERDADSRNNDPVKIGRIHKELARLHLSPHNPKRDLHQAAIELNKYLETERNDRRRDDTESMLKLLKEINGLELKVTTLDKELDSINGKKKSMKGKDARIKQLSKENKTLKTKQDELLADNKKLRTTIEKLKFLDLNLEKKRKTFQ